MSFDVRCPGCDAGYLVAEKDIGGEFTCPLCQTNIPLTHPSPRYASTEAASANPVMPGVTAPSAPTDVAASAGRSTPGATTVQPAPATATTAHGASIQAVTPAAPAAPAATSPIVSSTAAAPMGAAAANMEVCCPRCKMHFVPKGWAQRQTVAQKSILVVEDMTYFKQIAKDALADRYELRFAGSNVEAQSMLSRGGVDLMLLDLNLENGDLGIDLLRSLSGKPCPILIFTSKDESEMYGEQWEELRSLGADDLVVKGMNVNDSLVHKVATLLGDEIDEDREIG